MSQSDKNGEALALIRQAFLLLGYGVQESREKADQAMRAQASTTAPLSELSVRCMACGDDAKHSLSLRPGVDAFLYFCDRCYSCAQHAFDPEMVESRVRLLAELDRYKALAAPSATPPTGWKPSSERPDVKLGTEQLCWVAAKRENGKVYVYESWWVNRPVSEEENVEYGWEVQNEDGDPLHCVGWHRMGANSSYDEFFMPEENAAQIIAWMPITKPSAPTDGKEDSNAS